MKAAHGVAIGVVLLASAGVAAFFIRKESQPAGRVELGETAIIVEPEPVINKPYVMPEPIGIFKDISESVTNMVTGKTRGVRNNNPLNIEWNSLNNWVGQVGNDGRFSIFDKPENGIRAAAKVLDSYARRGVKTIAQIVRTWAPAVENNTESYIAHVEALTGWPRSRTISRADYVPLLKAMIRHENANFAYPPGVVEAGVAAS